MSVFMFVFLSLQHQQQMLEVPDDDSTFPDPLTKNIEVTSVP